MRRSSVAFLLSAIILAAAAAQVPSGGARFEIARDDVLIDEVIPIVVSGLAPGAVTTVHASAGVGETHVASSATFVADRDGRVDLTQMSPKNGSYSGVDPMGLFWSYRRTAATATDTIDDGDGESATPDRWTLTAEVNKTVVAHASLLRRTVAAER